MENAIICEDIPPVNDHIPSGQLKTNNEYALSKLSVILHRSQCFRPTDQMAGAIGLALKQTS